MSKSKEQKARDIRNMKRRQQRANKLATPKNAIENKKNIEILKKRASKELKKLDKQIKSKPRLIKDLIDDVQDRSVIEKNSFVKTFGKNGGQKFEFEEKEIKPFVLPVNVTALKGSLVDSSDDVVVKISLIPINNLTVTLEDNSKIKFIDKSLEVPRKVPPIEFLPPQKGILRAIKNLFNYISQFFQDLALFIGIKYFLFKLNTKSLSKSSKKE